MHALCWSVFKKWLPLAVAITLLCGLVYVVVQQNYRLSLNDPQIQMAEDVAHQLASGVAPTSLVPSSTIDIAQSLAPYIVVYDDALKPLAFSGTLDGLPPQPPQGVFDAARAHGEDRLSWQPRAMVRSAIVVVRVNDPHGGFVLAGRSMHEVEDRESQLEYTVGIAWLCTLIVTLAIEILATLF